MDELNGFIKTIPELSAVLGDENSSAVAAAAAGGDQAAVRAAIKGAFTSLMKAAAATIKTKLAALVERTAAKSTKDPIDLLLLRLDEQYPGGDVGCFCIYFMNVLTLKVGRHRLRSVCDLPLVDTDNGQAILCSLTHLRTATPRLAWRSHVSWSERSSRIPRGRLCRVHGNFGLAQPTTNTTNMQTIHGAGGFVSYSGSMTLQF